MATSGNKIVIRPMGSGEFEWCLKVRGKVVAQSTNNFTTAHRARVAAEAFQRHAVGADIIEANE